MSNLTWYIFFLIIPLLISDPSVEKPIVYDSREFYFMRGHQSVKKTGGSSNYLHLKVYIIYSGLPV